MPALTAGGPALVHFVDFAQLNSVRTLPYLTEWERRYREAGLSVIGVQAPRFPFGAEPRRGRRRAWRALGVEFPVAIDADHELWAAYGCEGWPSLFLWSLGGALAWAHFGEGEYRATEEAIQDELREIDALQELPEPMAPLRPTDAPGARVIAPTAGALPRRLLGAALGRGRGRRGPGARLPGRRRLRDGRGRGRDRGRDRRRVDARSPADPAPASAPWPSTRATRPTASILRPTPGLQDLVGQLRRRRALERGFANDQRRNDDHQDSTSSASRPPTPSAPAPSTSTPSACGPTRTAASSSGPATPASGSGSRPNMGMEFAPQKNAHPALHVDDVAAARAELEAKGVEFTGDTFDTGVCHMALFTDPDGNDLMLHHRYAPYERL